MPLHSVASVPGERHRRPVRLIDRIWDAIAVLLVIGGVAFFFVARRALTALANGSYDVPAGTSWVSRADLHVAQSRLAIWIIVLGMLVGVVAALRHRLRAT
jgi:hypothetical protein